MDLIWKRTIGELRQLFNRQFLHAIAVPGVEKTTRGLSRPYRVRSDLDWLCMISLSPQQHQQHHQDQHRHFPRRRLQLEPNRRRTSLTHCYNTRTTRTWSKYQHHAPHSLNEEAWIRKCRAWSSQWPHPQHQWPSLSFFFLLTPNTAHAASAINAKRIQTQNHICREGRRTMHDDKNKNNDDTPIRCLKHFEKMNCAICSPRYLVNLVNWNFLNS